MMKHLLKRILKQLGNSNGALRKSNTSDNVVHSIIQKTNLVHKSARIQYSELKGNVEVAEECVIYKAVIKGEVSVGKYTTINGPSTEIIAEVNAIIIGKYCSIASNTVIRDHNHNIKSATSFFIKKRIFKEGNTADVVTKGPVTIGNDVWVGTQSVILTGVEIGHGAVVAAKSLVNKNVPPYAIVGGVPAKILGFRFDDKLIEAMIDLKWWNWDVKKIENNRAFFDGDLSLEKIENIK